MRNDEKNALAAAALAAAKFVTSSGHARTNCPFCFERVGKEDRKQCLAISVRSGWYSCWRCGVKGRIDGEYEPAPSPPVRTAPTKVPQPEGFYELGEGPGATALSFAPARRYLAKRLPDPKVWREAHIGASLQGRASHRVIVPILSPEGEWWGWVGRDWTGQNERKYLNSTGMTVGSDGHFFNHAALLADTPVPLLVMEGCFDALAYWPDAVAVLGKPTEPQIQALLAAPRPIAVVLDGDAWREGEMLGLRLRMDGQLAGSVRMPPGMDPDEIDPAVLRQQAEECLGTAQDM